METIQDKYKRIRPLIHDGDLLLFRGTKLLAQIIQHSDREPDGTPAYFNHIGIVIASHGSLFIVDSQSEGVVADRLSKRINDYHPNGDFCVIHSINHSGTDKEVDDMLARQDMNDILYDYRNGFKELLNRRFGWNLKIKDNDAKDICSDFVHDYAVRKKMVIPFECRVAFPMDYIRYRNVSETTIIGYDGSVGPKR